MNEMQKNDAKRPSRQTQQNALVALAVLATLVAIFYLVEDWRGKRAWETLKQKTEAKGVPLDWAKLIPTPVPDEQNFYTASSNITIAFRKPQTDVEKKLSTESSWLHITYQSNSFPIYDNQKNDPLLVAVLNISPTAANPNAASHDLVANFNDADSPAQVRSGIQKIIGRSARGAAGFEFSELQLSDIKPARILLRADTQPTVADLENFLPPDLDTNFGHLRIEAAGDNATFRVLLAGVHVTTAEDYLKWSDQFEPALDEIREALKRPYALLPGDYSQPALIPIPNFVTLRAVAQTLAQRAQCDYLLDRPDQALREMTLIHDICRTLKRIPAGKPVTLVESMINVAIAGLYANTVADGLRLHAWKESQLAALQQQLKDDDLLSLVVDSLHSEEASSCHSAINLPSPELQKLFWSDKTPLLQKLKDPVYIFSRFAPRGWLYQNAVTHVVLMDKGIESFDVSNQLIFPKTTDAWVKSFDKTISRWDPYSFVETITLPNISKATQRTAYNQTEVNEAQVACALERYRLAHGEYPETLDALVPQFIEILPHDVIGGHPLNYRRADRQKFVLYSVGWNETDDGGVPETPDDLTKGDWVWRG
jgi:hypothetical protein